MTSQQKSLSLSDREGRPRQAGWRLEPRDDLNRWWQVVWIVLALAAALGVSAILVLIARLDVGQAFAALFLGAFGSRRAILDTMLRSTPLILTGLAAAFAFRARVWNIGGEGQLVAGAMGAYFAYTLFNGLPRPLFFLLVLLFAFLGGALLGGLVGLLKVRFKVDEIISTMMLNYIILYVVSFMLSGAGPWREPGSYYQQTALIAPELRFPILVHRSQVHMGFVVALVTGVLIKIILDRTPLGYDTRALGFNPTALRFKGTNVPLTIVIILLISGGLAGMAGAGEVFGVHNRLVLDVSKGLGYTGIIVAMLAAMDPLGVIVAGLLFGGLTNGAYRLQTTIGIPSAFIDAIQAIVLLFVLAAFVLSRYRIRKVEDAQPNLPSSHPG